MAPIVWFRRDLRLADHAALLAACADRAVIALYILDDTGPADSRMGGAARWWLHHSLAELDEALRAKGSRLILRRGAPADILPAVIAATAAQRVVWGRRYDAHGIATDTALKADLKARGIVVDTFNTHLLREPWTVSSGAGTPFKVFTSFWKAAQAMGAFDAPLSAPARIPAPAQWPDSERLEDWGLLPTRPNWATGFDVWTPGEAGAIRRLADFLAHGLSGYATGRDRPDQGFVSRLSPHLAFGEISARQAAHSARLAAQNGSVSHRDADKFVAELGWREFSYHLLYQAPDLPHRNFKPAFDAYPWRDAPDDLRAWQRGQTGYPIVDAGMRELWATGWMHNRARMIAASFIIKHLRIDWRHGERWFWDTLVDADVASNAASWQWVAGSGADAAPYFRIFNPMMQGEKFDPNGDYVRRWVPELRGLPTADLHTPWLADPAILRHAGVRLGDSYPRPIVDHAEARAAALAGYEAIKHPAPA